MCFKVSTHEIIYLFRLFCLYEILLTHVKEEAFFTILNLHGIKLTDAEKTKLKKAHSRAGLIKYADALQAVSIDLDSAVLNEEKWTVQKQADGKAQEA